MLIYVVYIFLGLLLGFIGLYFSEILPKMILMTPADASSEEMVADQIYFPTTSDIKKLILQLLDKPYPSIILLIGMVLLSTMLAHRYGLTMRGYGLLIFCWALLVLALIDWQDQLLPDALTLPVMWLGLIMQLDPQTRLIGISNAVWACVAGYLFFRVLAYIFFRIRGIEGLGRGDMKLVAMIGAWLGLIALPVIIFLACILSLLYVLGSKLFNRSQTMDGYRAFGPWIILATFLYFF